jgi:thiamine pyrophosphokinase
LRADVKTFYSGKGVTISQDTDQESTDFGKAMQKAKSVTSSITESLQVIILGTIGGRIDHGLGLLHEMLREEMKILNSRLWLFSENSISFILNPGQNIIQASAASGLITENAGIIPIYGPAIISTSGFEWDVRSWRTSMGTQVSTSNHIKRCSVTVETDQRLLFTVELAGKDVP